MSTYSNANEGAKPQLIADGPFHRVFERCFCALVGPGVLINNDLCLDDAQPGQVEAQLIHLFHVGQGADLYPK